MLSVPTVAPIGGTSIVVGSLVAIPVGGTYTEQGATFKDDDGSTRAIQPSSGTVNTAVPGLYVLSYSQKSASGIYNATGYRLVAVTSVNNPINYSGTYNRAATGVNAIVSKVANGVYQVQNPGGAAAGVGLTVYFVETGVNTFIAPPQPTDHDGTTSVTDITFTLTGASWKVINPGYGTAIRSFVKQ